MALHLPTLTIGRIKAIPSFALAGLILQSDQLEQASPLYPDLSFPHVMPISGVTMEGNDDVGATGRMVQPMMLLLLLINRFFIGS